MCTSRILIYIFDDVLIFLNDVAAKIPNKRLLQQIIRVGTMPLKSIKMVDFNMFYVIVAVLVHPVCCTIFVV